LKKDEEIWGTDNEFEPVIGSGDIEHIQRMRVCKRIRRYGIQTENVNL
jgi:hypothetical protein